MLVSAINQYNSKFNKEMRPLLIADNGGDWAVRYLWIQSIDDNQAFISNYFRKNISDSASGKNIRNSTTHLADFWKTHNAIFDNSSKNGNLVWRIKTLNKIEMSIDYIEIWRNVDLIEDYFLLNDRKIKICDNLLWSKSEKNSLAEGLFESGFVTRLQYPIMTISKQLALEYYYSFIKNIDKDILIVNCPYSEELNP